jgi:Fe2+ or Zn2+ uptake regulation protein
LEEGPARKERFDNKFALAIAKLESMNVASLFNVLRILHQYGFVQTIEYLISGLVTVYPPVNKERSPYW